MSFTSLPHPEDIAAISTVIAAGEAAAVFETAVVVPPPIGIQRSELVSLTTLYMTPGRPKPRLYKVVHLPGDHPSEVRKISEDHCLEPIKRMQQSIHHDTARNIARIVMDTCQGLEARASMHDIPFAPLGLLAVYQTDIYVPFAVAFHANPFVDELSRHVQAVPPDRFEEVYATDHTLQAEHNVAMPAYDICKERAAAIKDETSEKRQRYAAARGIIHLLTQPRGNTHPLLNTLLF